MGQKKNNLTCHNTNIPANLLPSLIIWLLRSTLIDDCHSFLFDERPYSGDKQTILTKVISFSGGENDESLFSRLIRLWLTAVATDCCCQAYLLTTVITHFEISGT